jgi:hypothetical protein
MPWIQTHAPSPDHPQVAAAMQDAMRGYPPEYGPARQAESRLPPAVRDDSIVGAHSLLPDVLRHTFSAYRAMLDPALPLSRRQHEMIAASVSILNDCFY